MVKITRERVASLTEVSSTEELIRSAIIAELDAVSLYQSQIENTESKRSKVVFTHIVDEEKEHISELMCLLNSFDKTQREQLYKQYPHKRNRVRNR